MAQVLAETYDLSRDLSTYPCCYSMSLCLHCFCSHSKTSRKLLMQSVFTLRPDIARKPEVYHQQGLSCVHRDNKCTALLKPSQLSTVDCLFLNTAFKAEQLGGFTKKSIFYWLRWRSKMKTVESSYRICWRDTPAFKGEQCTCNCINRVKCLYVSPSLETKNSKGLQGILQVSQDTP